MPPATPWPRHLVTAHKFDRHDFLSMLTYGIIRPEDPVELIDGEVVAMAPSGPQHAEFVDRLVKMFADVHDRAQVRVQGSLGLSDWSVVDPDFMLLRARPGGYADALPEGGDVLLLIEVADASLLRDREVKGSLYAQAGVRDYWIVNLVDRSIIVHREPGQGRYGIVETIRGEKPVAPLAFPDKTLRVGDLFY